MKRRVRIRFREVFASLVFLAVATSCTEADVNDGRELPTGERLQVEIPVTEVPLQPVAPLDTKALPDTTALPDAPAQQSAPAPATRAAATYKRAIVLQYSADGNTLLNAGTTDIDTYTIGASISAQLKAATGCKLYVYVVNETTTTGAGTAFDTEAKLKAATYDLYGKFATATAADVPLIGSLSGINVVSLASGSGNLGVIQNPTESNSKVMLSRIAAELNIRLYYNLPGFSITPATATLQNVPQTFYLFEQPGTLFPAENAAAAFGSVSIPLTSFDGDKTNESATTFVRFMPTNRRGSTLSIAYPKDKWSGTAPRTTTDRCTYLTFTATNKANSSHRLTYSFYFGGNNTTNFDVLRNYIYTMNSTILQRSEGDHRIVEGGLAPQVVTEPTVESVSSTGATLVGKLTGKGGTSIISYGFYYKKGTHFANPANPAADGTKAGEKTGDIALNTPFTHALTGLTANTAYYFVAYATSANGTSYGEPAVFGTNAAGLPVLGTQANLVSAPDGRSATSSGNTTTGTVLSNGIVWSATSGFDHLTSGTRASGNPATDSPYAVTVSPLTPGTTYYYRYFASNASGFVYGTAEKSVRAFDTPTVSAAAAVTSPALNTLRFTATTAQKNAADPLPSATGVKLWTTDPGSNLGTAAAVTVPYDSPTTVGAKTIDWTAMAAGQTYWYASYTTNTVGTGYSAKQSFTASAALPAATLSPATVGPQKSTVTVTTPGRNTNASVTAGGTVTSGNGTASKALAIADYTTATTARTLTVTLTSPSELPQRQVAATLTQYGVVFPGSFTNVANVSKAGQSATAVSVTANIPWTATSNQTAWCTIASGTQTGANTQAGDAKSFTYTVSKNIGAARTATITVAGVAPWTGFSKTFTVSQLPGGQVNLTPDDPNEDKGDVIFERFPILDLSGESNLLTPAEAVARRSAMNGQTPSNSALLSVGAAVSGVDGTWNAKLSPRFQVMRANAPYADWATAYAYCTAYAGEGGAAGQWRLPTQKELLKLYEKRSQLVGKGGFVPFSAGIFWSSTESTASRAWCVNFTSGSTNYSGKTATPYVRCVRDL